MALANPVIAQREPYLDHSNPLRNLSFGAEVYSFNYEEPNFMEDDGVLYGGFITWEQRSQDNQPVHSFRDLFSQRVH